MKRHDAHRRGLNHHKGKRIVGAKYIPSCGRCSVPPWELCACSDAQLLELNARTVAPVMIERAARMADKINEEAETRLSFILEIEA